MAIRIAVINRQKTLPVDRARVRRVVQSVLRDAKIEEAHVNVAVVDDAAIAKLHEQFLGDPHPTDVLSFVLECSGGRLEGEIAVSADTARAAAPLFAVTPEDELLRYVIHGALHLVGFDDAAPRQRAAMRKREQYYLNT
jgi:probable rRNA maturation factor